MRTATSDNYLTAGIAYAFHMHRDTWYSAPFCQLNWWMPIYDIEPENAMAFHPRYWNRPVRNGSCEYNYDEWNKTGRKTAALQVKTDTRKQPRPEEPVDPDPQIRVILPVGGTSSRSRLHRCIPLCPTPQGAPASASISGQFKLTTLRRVEALPISTRRARVLLCGIICAGMTSIICR